MPLLILSTRVTGQAKAQSTCCLDDQLHLRHLRPEELECASDTSCRCLVAVSVNILRSRYVTCAPLLSSPSKSPSSRIKSLPSRMTLSYPSVRSRSRPTRTAVGVSYLSGGSSQATTGTNGRPASPPGTMRLPLPHEWTGSLQALQYPGSAPSRSAVDSPSCFEHP
ncbi:uncharacterized protein J3D65DRAFT_131078 [Phyllosticta citribraziliensis]|uniref:Uncharacterized protein n=1 Tax=Phyllosticta citribraziliensis TaxID=989973 RepID=A0ABR1L5W6_9PEZI